MMPFVTFMTSGLVYICHRVCHTFRDLEDRSGEEDVAGKVVVITGANAGLGKVVALQMAKRKAIVVMACRDIVKAEAVIKEIRAEVDNPTLVLVKLDLGSLASVRDCAAEIKGKFSHINVLINNAGYMGTGPTIERTADGFEKNMGVNHLGHFLLTYLLLDLVKRGAPSRIICVGSLTYENAQVNTEDINMEEDTWKGFANLRPYSNSKMCNMLFVKGLAKRLRREDRVNTYTLCPGLVDTDLFQDLTTWQKVFGGSAIIKVFGCKPEQGAETILHCSLSEACAEETGKAYRFSRPWRDADEKLEDDLVEAVWEVSEKLVGIKGGWSLPPTQPPNGIHPKPSQQERMEPNSA